MIILPQDDKKEARKQLDKEIADKYTITMLVFGDGKGEDQIASKADIRAQALSSTRRVVWVRDMTILTDGEKIDYTKNDPKIVVCTLNLDDKPVVHLNRTKAQDIVELEKAFIKAQKE